jgi:glutaredoxin
MKKNSLEITELSTSSPQINLKLPPSQIFQDSFEKPLNVTWKSIEKISNSPQLFINGTDVGDVIQY